MKCTWNFFIQSHDHGILPKNFGKITLYKIVAELKNKIIQNKAREKRSCVPKCTNFRGQRCLYTVATVCDCVCFQNSCKKFQIQSPVKNTKINLSHSTFCSKTSPNLNDEDFFRSVIEKSQIIVWWLKLFFITQLSLCNSFQNLIRNTCSTLGTKLFIKWLFFDHWSQKSQNSKFPAFFHGRDCVMKMEISIHTCLLC